MISDECSTIWNYLAVGDGAVSDNATTLNNEVARVDTPEIITKTAAFDMIFDIDESVANGYNISEFGISSVPATNVSGSDNYAQIIKNNKTIIMVTILARFLNM